ncbi:halo-CC-star protein HcsS [Halalkaliarchaeum desulfuricum]|uniref:halo-CC-star protein HcsS n=1 Tax=Halalkaliarchaeum desulfuricum TaxID=2055893 RepID=UPI0018777E88|nr:halo-CC-star protein HcsS [Halalkaliarchaeum desulfuricum]
MTTAESDVLEAAEAFGDALAAEQEDLDRKRFFGLVMRCNQAIEQEIGIDYGAVCGDDSCC